MPVSRLLTAKIPGLLLVLLAAAIPVSAQEELVGVRIQPDCTGWEWESYVSQAAERLALAVESRVIEGLPRREFVRDSSTTTLDFRFRVNEDGSLLHFSQLRPRKRYLSYLVRRTVSETNLFDPLPDDFPLFYLDCTVFVSCRFRPTGRYKRLYFQEPLDSLEKVDEIVILKPLSNEPLLLYEPTGIDNKELLDRYKKSLGLQDPITDTSSYTPLSFDGRRVAVYNAYDSLRVGTYQLDILRGEIIRELTKAGAIAEGVEYTPKKPAPAAPTPGPEVSD
ncbi:MAG: hypothetical protein JXQ83_15025, partial [Candidatus Glassbacteria bacterium]|nr:hypothetical protein [Candidatus Glassbacteria bacterium]